MSEQTSRLHERLERAVADVQVPPDLGRAVRAGGQRRLHEHRRRRRAGAVAGAVAVLVAAVVLAPATVSGGLRTVPPAATVGTTQPDRPVGLPGRMAGYSHLTGSVTLSPPGRAVALWQQGFGVELGDFPQALVLSAHEDAYRRVDLAERRGGGGQGDPGPMLLSPDGRLVAVGHHRGSDVAVVDLATGDVRRHAVTGARSVRPVAFSADGRLVAYLAAEQPTNPHSGGPSEGSVGVLDLRTGEARAWPDDVTATALAFSPDGRELAVQPAVDDGPGVALQVRDVDGRDARVVPGPGSLAGPHAWSPDGRLLAVRVDAGTLAFVDAVGAGARVPDPLGPGNGLGGGELLGWVSDREVVLTGAYDPQDTGPGDLRVLLVDLDEPLARPVTLTTLPTDGNYGVERFQLATALLPELQVRPAGDVDRGVWPLWLVVTAALGVGVPVVLLVRARRR